LGRERREGAKGRKRRWTESCGRRKEEKEKQERIVGGGAVMERKKTGGSRSGPATAGGLVCTVDTAGYWCWCWFWLWLALLVYWANAVSEWFYWRAGSLRCYWL